MLQAENTISKALRLKDQKIPYEKRVSLYKKACAEFFRAYEIDERVYTYTRIEEATDACWKAEEHEKEEAFKVYEEKYAKTHPVEFEHGDAGVNMDMGS